MIVDDGGDVIMMIYVGYEVENNVVVLDKEVYVEDEIELNVILKKVLVEDKECWYWVVVEVCGVLEEIMIGVYCLY